MQVRKYEKTTNYKFCAITNKDKKEKDVTTAALHQIFEILEIKITIKMIFLII